MINIVQIGTERINFRVTVEVIFRRFVVLLFHIVCGQLIVRY